MADDSEEVVVKQEPPDQDDEIDDQSPEPEMIFDDEADFAEVKIEEDDYLEDEDEIPIQYEQDYTGQEEIKREDVEEDREGIEDGRDEKPGGYIPLEDVDLENYEPPFRTYMLAFAENQEKLAKEDIFHQRKPPTDIPRMLQEESTEYAANRQACFPLNAFNIAGRHYLPDKLKLADKIRLWRKMRVVPPISGAKATVKNLRNKTNTGRWPGVWPCIKYDLAGERRKQAKRQARKKMGVLPCYLDRESEDSSENEMFDEFANCKELGHARIPPYCEPPSPITLVDRAAGLTPGLVDGDYILTHIGPKKDDKSTYTNVCLRGLTGMHLAELGPTRARQKTWKFCLYQAIVALLAKTQLRYKYAWSANIDYIYQHAWLLFTHVGHINVKKKQRFDDILIYNYKYSIEMTFIDEFKNVKTATDVPFDFLEDDLLVVKELPRKELTLVKKDLGIAHTFKDNIRCVHKRTAKIERWLESLKFYNKNCIFRTARYCLAFWKDGMFWYVYNPFRCDNFGMWHDHGYACIMKFCSRKSMIRYFMILLLRAYVYEPNHKLKLKLKKQRDAARKKAEEEMEAQTTAGDGPNIPPRFSESQERMKRLRAIEKKVALRKKFLTDTFFIQIFELKYNCGQIHNIKLFQKGGPKPKTQLIRKKEIDGCNIDPLDPRNSCELLTEKRTNDRIEKPEWLKTFKITWSRGLKRKCAKDVAPVVKPRWHQFYVEEPRRLFSLWGDMHVTDQIFLEENRGRQVHACYVVCAGMTRITAPEYWTSKTLDAIVMCGDRYYTHSVIEATIKSKKPENSHIGCWKNYLTNNFKIGEMLFEVNILQSICGKLYNRSAKYLWQTLEQLFLQHHFGILTCENVTLCVFKYCNAYYVYDANSIGTPLFNHGCGVSYLLRTTSFLKFMTILILTIGSSECSQFALNPIKILKVIDIGSANTATEKTNALKCETTKLLNSKRPPCPWSDDKKKKKKCSTPVKKKTLNQTTCKGCI